MNATVKIRIATLVGYLFLLCIPLWSAQSDSAAFAQALHLARKYGLDSIFLDRISAPSSAGFVAKAVRINVTNFSSTPDYSWSWNDSSIKTVKAFIKEHLATLTEAQKMYGVRKEVIASILWIESRCGKITGTYHVPSVYLSLLLASDSINVQSSVDRVVQQQKLDSTKIDSVTALVKKRAERKAGWAFKELRALQEIDKRKVMNVADLMGSWAGAFGFPQFLPSSYNAWAVDGNSDGVIDLYSIADAAHSIGNYLKKNGWGVTRKKQRAAVHHYNNSDAYVNAVFTLARKLK